MRKIWSPTKGLTWTMDEFDAAKAKWQASYPTPQALFAYLGGTA